MAIKLELQPEFKYGMREPIILCKVTAGTIMTTNRWTTSHDIELQFFSRPRQRLGYEIDVILGTM